MKPSSRLLAILLLCLSVGSCTVIKVQALTPGKTYAVVSTYVSRHLQESSVKLRGQRITEFPKLKDRVNGITLRYLSGFRKVVPFRLIHGKQIIKSRDYRNWKPVDKSQGSDKLYQPANGYHIIAGNDLNRMGELARKLKVDGVIIIYHQISVREPENQLEVSSMLSPAVTTTISAWDKQGKQVLQDTTIYNRFPGVDFRQKQDKALNDVLDVVADHMEEAGAEYGENLKKKIGQRGGGTRPL